MIPGEIVTVAGDLELNTGRRVTRLTVANTGDRPIQVGSHYHFYETNAALSFDREAARGNHGDFHHVYHLRHQRHGGKIPHVPAGFAAFGNHGKCARAFHQLRHRRGRHPP